MQDKFADKFPDMKFEQWRSKVGSFGVTGDAQLNPIENLRCVWYILPSVRHAPVPVYTWEYDAVFRELPVFLAYTKTLGSKESQEGQMLGTLELWLWRHNHVPVLEPVPV